LGAFGEISALIIQVAIMALMLASAPALVWLERRIASVAGGDRHGSSSWIFDIKIGGLLHTTVDFIRFFSSRGIARAKSVTVFGEMSGIFSLAASVLAIAPVRFAGSFDVGGVTLNFGMLSIESSIVYSIAAIAISFQASLISVVMSSPSERVYFDKKYSGVLIYLAANMLSVIAVSIPYSFDFDRAIMDQAASPLMWNIAYQPLSFVVFVVSMAAMHFGLLMEYGPTRATGAICTAASYIRLFAMSVVCATLFLGGWNPPFILSDKEYLFVRDYLGILISLCGVAFIVVGGRLATGKKKVYDDIRDYEWRIAGISFAVLGLVLVVAGRLCGFVPDLQLVQGIVFALLQIASLVVKSLAVCSLVMFLGWQWPRFVRKISAGFLAPLFVGLGIVSLAASLVMIFMGIL
jgi:NADH:ubiquinone oxidoreductase subunit H